jgi:Mg-chelatase subunit ChlD
VLVSDARANVPERDAFAAALHEVPALKAQRVRSLCIDVESGRIRLGNARRLADALGATYRHIRECDERTLGAAVREWMAIA